MLRHIVCFQFHDKKDAAIAREKLLALKGVIPEILEMEVGIDVLSTHRSYDMALVATFEDQAALEAYDKHSAHLAVREYIQSVRKASVAVDYIY